MVVFEVFQLLMRGQLVRCFDVEAFFVEKRGQFREVVLLHVGGFSVEP